MSVSGFSLRINGSSVVIQGADPIILQQVAQRVPELAPTILTKKNRFTSYTYTCINPAKARELADRLSPVPTPIPEEMSPSPTKATPRSPAQATPPSPAQAIPPLEEMSFSSSEATPPSPAQAGGPLRAEVTTTTWNGGLVPAMVPAVRIANSTPEILAAMSKRGMPCAELGGLIPCNTPEGAQAVADRINQWLAEDTHSPGSINVMKTATRKETTIQLEQVRGPEGEPSSWRVTVAGLLVSTVLGTSPVMSTIPADRVTQDSKNACTIITFRTLGEATQAFQQFSDALRGRLPPNH